MLLVFNNFWLRFVIIVLLAELLAVCQSYVLIQGDMLFKSTPKSVEKLQTESVRSKRNAVTDRDKLWESGVIPYEFDWETIEFNDFELDAIHSAMRHWEKYTCIIFVKRDETQHEDFIRFTTELADTEDTMCDCCSAIGRTGGPQDIGVGGCSDKASFIHELGHAIGFVHEQKRPDRDEYVEIIEDNVVDPSQYTKLTSKEVDTLGEKYDFDSIMHYGLWEQQVNDIESGAKTLNEVADILPKEGKRKAGSLPYIKGPKRLSPIDIRKTKKLYECPTCGRTYLDQEDAFTSPEYYSISRLIITKPMYRCEWRIFGEDDQRIELEISDLDILESINCENDYLEVRDGYWHKSPLLGRFCGNNIPKRIVSTGNHMVINYVSRHLGHRGFAANYTLFI